MSDEKENGFPIESNFKASLNAKIDVPADVSREALAFFQRIIGPVAEASDFLSDKIRFFRWKSAAKTISRAREIAKQRGVEPQEIPLKFLVPFLEKSSLEDEDSPLIEGWANLLVGASQDFNTKHKIYIDILSVIGGKEAKFLKELRENLWTLPNFMSEILLGDMEDFFFEEQMTRLVDEVFNSLFETPSESPISVVPISESFEKIINGTGGSIVNLSVYGVGFEIIKDEAGITISQELIPSIYHLQSLNLVEIQKRNFDRVEKNSNRQLHLKVCWVKLTTIGVDFVVTCEGLRA